MAVPAEDRPFVVALEVKDFRTFLNAFSANVSRSGMFLDAVELRPPGSEIDFEFALEGGDALLRGRGEVVWVTDDGGADAAGMGVRFLELDPGSEQLIERIEEIRTKSGRDIFDVERGTRPETRGVAGADPTLDLLRAELESLKEAHLRDRARLVADLDTVRLDRDRLAKHLSAIQDSDVTGERDRLQSELEAVRAELQSVQGGVAQLEQRIEDQDADLARFAEQGRYAMVERDRLEASKKTLATELEAARAEVERLESERQELSGSAGELEQAKSTLAEARASEAALREELAEARATAERIEEEARLTDSQLRSELEELLASQAELRAGLEFGQSELDNVRGQFEEAAGKNLELEHEASSVATQLTEARERLEDLESASAATQAEMEKLRSRHESMESELAAQRKAAKRARKVAQRVRAEHAKLQEDLAEAQATLEELHEENASVEAQPRVDVGPEERSMAEVGAEGAEASLTESPEENVLADEEREPVAEDEDEGERLDLEVESWTEETSGRSMGSGLWATITNKLMGEADADEPHTDPSDSDRSEVDELEVETQSADPRSEAPVEDAEAAVGRS